MEHAGTTEGGETVGGSSCGSQLSPGGRSAEMISDGCSDANRKVLVKGVGENLLPTAQAWGLWRPGPPVAAPGTGNRHIDLFCYLSPGQALVTQLQDLLCGGGMSGRTAATHGDAGPLELLADRAPMNAQLGTDLAQGPTLGVQVGCTLNVHRATVTSLSARIADGRECWSDVVASSAPLLWRAQGHDRGQDGGDGDVPRPSVSGVGRSLIQEAVFSRGDAAARRAWSCWTSVCTGTSHIGSTHPSAVTLSWRSSPAWRFFRTN